MIFILDIDLGVPKMYLHTKNKSYRSRHSKVRARTGQTHIQWHTHTHTNAHIQTDRQTHATEHIIICCVVMCFVACVLTCNYSWRAWSGQCKWMRLIYTWCTQWFRRYAQSSLLLCYAFKRLWLQWKFVTVIMART